MNYFETFVDLFGNPDEYIFMQGFTNDKKSKHRKRRLTKDDDNNNNTMNKPQIKKQKVMDQQNGFIPIDGGDILKAKQQFDNKENSESNNPLPLCSSAIHVSRLSVRNLIYNHSEYIHLFNVFAKYQATNKTHILKDPGFGICANCKRDINSLNHQPNYCMSCHRGFCLHCIIRIPMFRKEGIQKHYQFCGYCPFRYYHHPLNCDLYKNSNVSIVGLTYYMKPTCFCIPFSVVFLRKLDIKGEDLLYGIPLLPEKDINLRMNYLNRILRDKLCNYKIFADPGFDKIRLFKTTTLSKTIIDNGNKNPKLSVFCRNHLPMDGMIRISNTLSDQDFKRIDDGITSLIIGVSNNWYKVSDEYNEYQETKNYMIYKTKIKISDKFNFNNYIKNKKSFKNIPHLPNTQKITQNYDKIDMIIYEGKLKATETNKMIITKENLGQTPIKRGLFPACIGYTMKSLDDGIGLINTDVNISDILGSATTSTMKMLKNHIQILQLQCIALPKEPISSMTHIYNTNSFVADHHDWEYLEDKLRKIHPWFKRMKFAIGVFLLFIYKWGQSEHIFTFGAIKGMKFFINNGFEDLKIVHNYGDSHFLTDLEYLEPTHSAATKSIFKQQGLEAIQIIREPIDEYYIYRVKQKYIIKGIKKWIKKNREFNKTSIKQALGNIIEFIMNDKLFNLEFNTFYDASTATDDFNEKHILKWKRSVIKEFDNKLLMTTFNISIENEEKVIDQIHFVNFTANTLRKFLNLESLLKTLKILMNCSISHWCMKYHFFNSPKYTDLLLFLYYKRIALLFEQ